MLKDYGRTAIIAGEHRISFNEILLRVDLFKKSLSVGRGEKCLILSENREGWIYALYSIWQQGGIAVPVDATSTAHDIAYILKDSQPASIWTSRNKSDIVNAALKEAEIEVKICLIDDFERVDLNETGHILQPATFTPKILDETCLIIYTSGTTGNPKGVMLSFWNILAVIKAVSEDVEIITPDRRVLILLPLHHILPLVGTVLAPMKSGGGVTICPSMAAPDLMATLKNGEVDIIVGVPRLWQTIYNGVMKVINDNLDNPELSVEIIADKVGISRVHFYRKMKDLTGQAPREFQDNCGLGQSARNPLRWCRCRREGPFRQASSPSNRPPCRSPPATHSC